jgi:hypothetical protein
MSPSKIQNHALLTVTAALALVGGAQANILSNPGFETPTTTSTANVLNNFPGFAGIWGPEMGSITTATLGVTPATGSRMLGMTNAGGTHSQTFQAVDVSAFSGMINAGQAQMVAGALYNTNGGYTGASALVTVQFFTSSTYSSLIGNSGFGTLLLDNDPTSWESASVTSMIPVGTTWVVYQIAYSNASIGNNTGFVDDAYLRINQIPAPGAIAAFALAALGARRRR